MKTAHSILMTILLVAGPGIMAACGGGDEGGDVAADPVEMADPGPGDSQPDSTQPDSTQPDSTQPDSTQPDNSQVDMGADDTAADVAHDRTPPVGTLVADHQAVTEFGGIPASFLDAARSSFNIYYGHTSHGSQVVTGIEMLEAEDDSTTPGLYDRPPMTEDSPDLGYPEWEPKTRAFLDAHPETNLVMWSWCGQMSSLTTEDVDTYLSLMSALEAAYPGVTFVYMTGHLDGGGTDGTLYANNNHVRDYCTASGKVLFDFADIESWDPGGTYYPDESDACGWCSVWCAANTCPDCGGCAHSHCFNCYQKGKAFWWMMARLSGWEG